ncbi:MAG: DUF4271 domain-containing protein [Draconibacterium sp.]|nr:DUF4271 domain-containing protein [Draconibacterium sp.]
MSEAVSTLNIFSEIAHVNGFELPQYNEQSDTITQTDTPKPQKDTVPPPPTLEQIRYWQWLREKKLLINGSRYIQPKEKAKLVSSVKVENKNLELPIREKNSLNTDWITILLLLVVILFASVRISYSSYVTHLFQSLLSYSTSFRLFRERNYPLSHGAFRLDIIFYFTFSVFIYQVINTFQLELTNENLTIYVVGLVLILGYFILKKIIYFVVGLAFESVSETNEYLFNMDSFNRTLGIVLFPVVVLINYYPSENPLFMVFTGIFIVAVFYAFLLQRGIYILLQKHFSIFYLFLYLCTLEFLPLFLIYNVVVL